MNFYKSNKGVLIIIKNIREIVDIQQLQEIQDQFAEAVGVAVLICDANGEPITKPSRFTGFCMYVRSCEEGLKRCILSDQKIGNLAFESNRPAIHRCHSGLVDFAAPIVLKNQYLGSVLCGQVLMNEEELNSLQTMEMDVNELPLDKEILMNYFVKLESKAKSRVESIAEILFLTANYIVKIGDAYLANEELSIKNEKLLEEVRIRSDLEEALLETQLKVLQSQINPHFLFNTLNTISRLAYLENAEQTQGATYSLGKILRYGLRNIDQLVPLQEEINHLQNYLYIQQTRYRDKINLIIDIEDQLKDISIPIFSLQPIIENSIVHGFEPAGYPITITLRVFTKGKAIMIDITDDGIGIKEKEKLHSVVIPLPNGVGHTTGIGLNNVDKRIKYYFGDEWGISKVERRKKRGTLVQLTLPMKAYFAVQ